MIDPYVRGYIRAHLTIAIPVYLLMLLLEVFVYRGTASDFMMIVNPVLVAMNMAWFWPVKGEERKRSNAPRN